MIKTTLSIIVTILVSAAHSQNTRGIITVKDDFGVKISNGKLLTRYDNDHYDYNTWKELCNGVHSFRVGDWTGPLRNGSDYWHVTLEDPNSWATAVIKNDWGKELKNIKVNHRYDNDHFDARSYSSLKPGQVSSSFEVGFWTGTGRIGSDYWDIEFDVDGIKWSCKDNFSCYLTADDVNKNVVLRLYKEGRSGKMMVDCPVSSDCRQTLLASRIVNPENGRPFYLIAHRCNDQEDVGLALSRGCNAIECDLQFDRTANEFYVNHDFASGLTLSRWLNNARQLAEKHHEYFALIIFDCKFVTKNSSEVSQRLLKEVREKVRIVFANSPNPINIVYSISSYNNRDVFKDLVSDLLPNEGISIDEWDHPDQVEAYFRNINAQNTWYGNGIITMWEDPKFIHHLKKQVGFVIIIKYLRKRMCGH